MKMVSCMFQLPRVRPRQEPTTATSGTMMEGGMQLLNRDGHSISHNSKRHYHDSFVSMNRMRQRGLLCDIVLHVSNKEIKAHKVVLASCSPYFHAMFTSKFSPRFYSSTCLLFFCCSEFDDTTTHVCSEHHLILPASSLPSPLPVWGTGGQMRPVSVRFPPNTRSLSAYNVCPDSQLSGLTFSHLTQSLMKPF